MGHISNKDRIAKAAEEARLTAEQKTTKKPAKAAPGARPKRTPKEVRMKIVWEVCNGAGTAVKVFAYPDKAAAEAATAALTKSSERAHSLRATKVPME